MLRALRASGILKRKRNPAAPLRAAGAIVGAILEIIPECGNSQKPDRRRLSRNIWDTLLRMASADPEPIGGKTRFGRLEAGRY